VGLSIFAFMGLNVLLFTLGTCLCFVDWGMCFCGCSIFGTGKPARRCVDEWSLSAVRAEVSPLRIFVLSVLETDVCLGTIVGDSSEVSQNGEESEGFFNCFRWG